MRLVLRRMIWLVPTVLALLGLTLGTALAHEDQEVGEYSINIGWIDEPAYEGFKNGVEVRVTKLAQGESMSSEHGEPEPEESNGDHHDNGDAENGDSKSTSDTDRDHAMGGDDDGDGDSHEDADEEVGDHHAGGEGDDDDGGEGMSMSREVASSGRGHSDTIPVEGLEETLQVEVTHVASEASRVLDLHADLYEPGRYTAALIPTTPGVYQFRVFGTIEGSPVDQPFLSRGGGGGFDDIRSSAGLQFPEELPSARELESAVRGAIGTAQQAQDTALAASEGDGDDSGANILLILAIVLGALAVVSGVGGAVIAAKKKR